MSSSSPGLTLAQYPFGQAVMAPMGGDSERLLWQETGCLPGPTSPAGRTIPRLEQTVTHAPGSTASSAATRSPVAASSC